MSRLRATLVLLAFAGVTLPLMPVQQLIVWFWPRMARVFPMYYHRLVLRIIGVQVNIDGEALKTGPAILAANHVSWLDIVILSSLAPVSFIARHDVKTWPFFGALARLQRTVFVARARRHTSRSPREMRERLAARRHAGAFCEGTSGDACGSSLQTFLFRRRKFPLSRFSPERCLYRSPALPMPRICARCMPGMATWRCRRISGGHGQGPSISTSLQRRFPWPSWGPEHLAKKAEEACGAGWWIRLRCGRKELAHGHDCDPKVGLR